MSGESFVTKVTRRTAILGGAAVVSSAAIARPAVRPATVGTITRFDPALDRILDPSAPIEIIARGLQWAEGPVWVARGEYLLFSDVPANTVHRWTAREGAHPFLHPSGLGGSVPAGIREAGANGLAIDRSGALVMADSGTRAIARVDLATRKKTIFADRFEGKRFNSCNDLTIARDGTIYFTDPPYGLAEGDASPLKELVFNGVYRLSPTGEVDLIDASLRRPNGIALSPRQDRLYVGCSDEVAPEIRVYALGADGARVGEGRRLVDFTPELKRGWPGLPDGMKVARNGHLFATGPGGLYILAPDGRKLGLIARGKPIANCAFGEDGRTLFMASSDAVLRVRLRASMT
ncbi:SMP-30/gluconolactonase/LRE family protein [Sphingomonas sp. RHCKR47]|uniref:SMP-30/gluconolactonase/LRE family protein n=1 Tax=Sphingomonas citricola TaxID=2862498 RepID=UPI001C6726C9|nr:SMP-30/gluconolactonase/LRE family protein [Sphingomonas citricola]MBW6523572.1 SMP-30/gluconolactonase/LRE family protein [Sphingomonas citricola]